MGIKEITIKVKKIILLLLICCLSAANVYSKDYVNISNKWKFFPGTITNGQSASLDDGSWADVNIPHSWNAIDGQNGGGDYRRGDGWYRKRVDIPASADGKRVYVDIAAANMTTYVYVNGTLAGKHIGGYARFTYDITNYVKPGEKALIAIRVNNEDVVAPPRQADFTFSGGVQRNIRLIIANNMHIAPTNHIAQNSYLVNEAADIASPGIKIRQYEVSESSAKIDVTTRVRNSNGNSKKATAKVTVYDREGSKVTEKSNTVTVDANGNADITSTLSINNPHLWNGTLDPYLYRVVVSLKQDNEEVDSSVQPLGLRYFSVSKTDGFKLNGKSYPLRGFAFHEEYIDKGRALTDADRLRNLQIIRNSGANYVRISHYQHGDYTYNYCDSVGIICWTEIPVIDYMSNANAQNTFQQNAATQLYELIRQQYNHPSICFWGLCNEIRRENRGADVVTVIKALNNLAHSEDDTRLTTLAHDKAGEDNIKNYGEWAVPDVIAVNKYVGWYEGSRNNIASTFENRMTTVYNTSSKPIGMSEYGAGGSPFKHNDSDTGGSGNGSADHPEEFQAYSHEQHWSVIRKSKWFWATAVWAAFDFASDGRGEGDEAGINDKGLVTHDRGIKKDAYFVYQASLAKFGVVHIKSRRFLSRSNSVTVKAYSNCLNLKLRVNGGSWQDMVSDNAAVKLYKKDGVSLSNGANIIEVMGTYRGENIIDKAVWYVGGANNSIEAESGNGGNIVVDANASGQKRVEIPSGATLTLNYNAPEEGTYSMRIFYMTKQCRRMDVSANGYSATHYFGETGALDASKRRAVVMNVYLKKGNNSITFSNPDGDAPNLDYVSLYYYHVGAPALEDNEIPSIIPIPNNPNAGGTIDGQDDTANQFYIYNVGAKQWIKTGGLAKNPDSPELAKESERTANVLIKQDNGTYLICDPEYAPQAWGVQGRNTIYESNNGSLKTNSWGTTLIPGWKFISTGEEDGSVYIEYTWGNWTKGNLNIDNPSNKSYDLFYGDWALGTNNWSSSGKSDVTSKGVYADVKSNRAAHGDFARWLVLPVGNGNLEVLPSESSTGINSTVISKTDGTYYNLKGMRIGAHEKGLVIHNGKKVILD